MAERTLSQILGQLSSQPTLAYSEASRLLSRAKLLLLQLGALTPQPSTSPTLLQLARATYQLGALACIRALPSDKSFTSRLSASASSPSLSTTTTTTNTTTTGTTAPRDAFVRYVHQLQPFYELPASTLPRDVSERNKVTGLYLLLLLTEGRYAEFHSQLEALTVRAQQDAEQQHPEGQFEGYGGLDGDDLEGDRYLAYPVRLERWLMEGSYDRVWKAMKSREVPCEEYGVFSDILTRQIRSEIASSSERAYPKLPLSSTKSLLFLDSEGAVINFAHSRGWTVRDGEIFFPNVDSLDEDEDEDDDDNEDDDEDDEDDSDDDSENNMDVDRNNKSSSRGLASAHKRGGAADGGLDRAASRTIIENALGYAIELEMIV